MPEIDPTIDVTPDPDEPLKSASGIGNLETSNFGSPLDETQSLTGKPLAALSADSDSATLDFSLQSVANTDAKATPKPTRTVRIPGYEVLGELGRGAMGVVYKARQVRADRFVALKVMLNIDHARPQDVQRFEVEAQAAARLQHPGIVQVYDVGAVNGVPYFTQEFVDGGTLSQRLAKETLQPQVIAQQILQLVEAVAFAHSRGVVHRDLKPSNVLVAHDGTLKIADFGLARRMEDESHLTKDGTILGTPSYMAPEQAYGSSHEIGPLSDVYTLGAILYEFLVGRPPFKGATSWEVIEQVRSTEPVRPSEIERQVPKDLETICLKCLQKNPAQRYASANELAADLQRYLNNEPILARPIGRWERLVRLCRRHPGEARLVALVAGLLVTLTAGAVWTAIRISADRDHITKQRDQIDNQLQELEQKQQLADQRLKTRKRTISEMVNRLPVLQRNAPFSQGLSNAINSLSDELIETEQAEAQADAQMGPSRQWALLATELRRGEKLVDQAIVTTDDTVRNERLKTSLEHFSKALSIAEAVYDSGQGDRAKAAGNVASVLQGWAYVKRDLGQDGWLETLQRAIQLREEALAVEVAEDSVAKRQLQLAQTMRSKVGAIAGYSGASPAQLQEAYDACQRISSLIDSADGQLDEGAQIRVEEYRYQLHESAAKIAVRMNNDTAAAEHFRQCIDSLKLLCTEQPESFHFHKQFMRMEEEFGDWLLKHDRAGEARKEYIALLLNLHNLQAEESLAALNLQWAMVYYRLGLAAVAEKNEDRRKKYFGRVVEIVQARLNQREDLEGKSESQSLWDDRHTFMLAQAWAGNTEVAANMARRTITRFGKEKSDLAAVNLSAAAFALGIASQYVPEEHRAAAQAESLATLKMSIEAGYNNLDYLLTDPDVAPMRAIDGFEEVIKPLR